MGRGVGITFGKISVFSEGENLEACMEVLDKILKKHKYPEVEEEHDIEGLDDDEDEEALEEVSEAPEEPSPSWKDKLKIQP